MSAHMYIHILTIEEDIVKRFKSNVIGSKWEYSFTYQEHADHFNEDYGVIAKTPNILVGAVSWLKGGLFDDWDTYVPKPVEMINEVVGESFPTIDEEFILKVEKAMDLPNTTMYSVATKQEVVDFLRQHLGEKAFTVSWYGR